MNSKTTSIKKNASVFFKVLKYLKGYLSLFIISIILTLAVVVLTLYVPILIGQAIDLAIGVGNVDSVQIGNILVKIAICIGFTAI